MTFRYVVEIESEGRYLAKSRGFLTISANSTETGRVPLDDIPSVVVTSPANSVSCNLLSELAQRGIPTVICGRNYVPAAILWPTIGHHEQQRRISAQITANRCLVDDLWRIIVREKILQHGRVLECCGAPDNWFCEHSQYVRSGDINNLEATAARRYWSRLFGQDFRRDKTGGGINSMLNYGYAVLRAAVARAIVSSGLHPSIGLFHHSPQDPMPLADDLMEPFRPCIDFEVHGIAKGGITDITTDSKRRIARVLHTAPNIGFVASTLSIAIDRTAAGLA